MAKGERMIVKDEDMPKCKFCGGDYTQGGSVTSNAEAYWVWLTCTTEWSMRCQRLPYGGRRPNSPGWR